MDSMIHCTNNNRHLDILSVLLLLLLSLPLLAIISYSISNISIMNPFVASSLVLRAAASGRGRDKPGRHRSAAIPPNWVFIKGGCSLRGEWMGVAVYNNTACNIM